MVEPPASEYLARVEASIGGRNHQFAILGRPLAHMDGNLIPAGIPEGCDCRDAAHFEVEDMRLPLMPVLELYARLAIITWSPSDEAGRDRGVDDRHEGVALSIVPAA